MSAHKHAAGFVSSQGHYAGAVSRFVAFAIDITVSSGLFALALAAISYAAGVVTGRQVAWNRDNIVVIILFVGWQFFYFGYSWAANGKTLGMAALGVRVVRADGASADPWRGVVRALVFPLSFLFLGLGFLGILVQREHRALHDLIAGTAVVYAWDARAARLRFLAREAEPAAGGSSGEIGPIRSEALPEFSVTNADEPASRPSAQPGGPWLAQPSAAGDAATAAEGQLCD